MAQRYSQIPIEVTNRMREIVMKAPAAYILYTYLISKRFRDSGKCETDVAVIVQETGLSRATIFRAHDFLIGAKWAECQRAGSVWNWSLTVGFTQSHNETGESHNETGDMIGTRAVHYPKDSQRLPKPNTPKTPKDMPAFSAEVAEVFLYWQTKLDHLSARLTDGRKAKVEARRRAGYTVEQIKRAIDGCAASPFHRGLDDYGNRTGAVYDDLELICRDDTKLEKFIAIADRVPALVASSNGRASPAVTTPLIEHNRAAVEQAKREMREFQEKQNASG